MHTLLRFAGTVGAILLMLNLVPGVGITGGWTSLLLTALVWSVITMVVRPVLALLTFPITLITFGLFSFVLNAVLFYAMTFIVPGFHVASFWSAFMGSIVLSLAGWLIHKVV